MKEDLINAAYTVMMILSGAMFHMIWGWYAVWIYVGVLAVATITITVIQEEYDE